MDHKRPVVGGKYVDADSQTLITLEDVDVDFRAVILKIEPNLHDFALRYSPEDLTCWDVDWYFKDDPKINEEGYTGDGLTEYIPHSPTWNHLVLIENLLAHLYDLKFEN